MRIENGEREEIIYLEERETLERIRNFIIVIVVFLCIAFTIDLVRKCEKREKENKNEIQFNNELTPVG